MPIGKIVGRNLERLKKFIWIVLFGLLFGFLAEIAEPSLHVFARQTHLLVEAINETVFIWIMAIGIGVFVALGLWRILKNISIKWVFAVLYILLFIMAFVVPPEFIALAFDGSGATTGDISVPFILALGMGVSVCLSKRSDNDDTFGLIGIASVGPILAIFIYGLVLQQIHGGIPPVGVYDPGTAFTSIFEILWMNIRGVTLAIVPMLIVFVPFQLLIIKMPMKKFARLLLGMLPLFAGLLVFLSAIDYGFAFAGEHVGAAFLEGDRPSSFRWLLLPVVFVLGVAITLTEPAVTVLGEQLEHITNKKIKRMTIRFTLAIGIGVAAMLAVIKILTETNILIFLVPLYLTSLILMKFTPRLFVGLAFDSGGVTAGALTSALLTPLALGIAQAVAIEAGPYAQSVLTNGFGIIAFMSATPIIAVQILRYLCRQGYRCEKSIKKSDEYKSSDFLYLFYATSLATLSFLCKKL